MGITKTLSLILISSIISISSIAASLYVGGGASFSGVISESDYYNGASTMLPSANVGIQYGGVALDGFFRMGTLSNEHQGFDIDIKTMQAGFMFRFSPEEWMDLNIGLHWSSLEASSSVFNGQRLTGLINRSFTSTVMGLGFNIPFTEQIRVRTDFNYYLGKQKISIFQFDISVIYNVIYF